MMFLRYQNEQEWFELVDREDGLFAYNYNGGWHKINENSEKFMYGTIVTLDDWIHLYKLCGYCPLLTQTPTTDMWIAPDGKMYDCGSCGAHELTAQNIIEIFFDQEEEFWDSGDKLIGYGWVKVTTTLMYQYYHESGMYDSMTDEQWISYQLWREKYKI